MDLLGSEKITNILNNFLAQFELTAEMGMDFSYYYDDNLITYSLIYSEQGASDFMESVEEKSPTIDADVFLWSVLHEVGHHETIDELTEEEEEYSENTKRRILEENLPHKLYYNLPDEYAATSWAVQYAEEHFEEISDLWNKLREAIMEFYEANHVEVDQYTSRSLARAQKILQVFWKNMLTVIFLQCIM